MKVSEKTIRKLRYNIITKMYPEIDLTKDYFSQDWETLFKLEEFRIAFKFSGRNNFGRKPIRQFYYYLQKSL